MTVQLIDPNIIRASVAVNVLELNMISGEANACGYVLEVVVWRPAPGSVTLLSVIEV